MKNLNKFLKKNYTTKITFSGKSYKLSIKPNIYNFRFNRSNKNILVFNNIKIKNYRNKKQLYMYNCKDKSIIRKINKSMLSVRKYNTHTLRGIYTTKISLNKRLGRVSGYM